MTQLICSSFLQQLLHLGLKGLQHHHLILCRVVIVRVIHCGYHRCSLKSMRLKAKNYSGPTVGANCTYMDVGA